MDEVVLRNSISISDGCSGDAGVHVYTLWIKDHSKKVLEPKH